MNRRKLSSLLLSSIWLIPLLSCGSAHDADEKYFLISANIQVPYWQTAGVVLSQTPRHLQVRLEYTGPDNYDPKAQQQAFEQALQKKPTGILISVADPNVMKNEIDKAVAAGSPGITNNFAC